MILYKSAISFFFLVCFVWSITVFSMSLEKKQAKESDVFCAADVQICADGTAVARDPKNNCKFRSCPGEKAESIPFKTESCSPISEAQEACDSHTK